MARSSILAVIFEFDGILVPDSTTTLLKERGSNPHEFWEGVRKLVQSGYEPSLAYLNALLESIGPGRQLGRMTTDDLGKVGATLDDELYPGLGDGKLFQDLQKIASDAADIRVEFYIISAGLQELIEGSKVVHRHFKAVYGSRLAARDQAGFLSRIRRAISFTEKTRYLFEINKGIDPEQTESNPLLVNYPVSQSERRIPFRNMIYVGDALTDVPCFSIVTQGGGIAFGAFSPSGPSARRALQTLLKPGRTASVHAPMYEENNELGALLRAAVANRCSQIQLERQQVGEFWSAG